MLADDTRSALLECAIKQAGVEGQFVFEIGAGTGIIALLCARLGAARVVTCEVNPQLAAVAKEIVAACAFADHIEVKLGSSRDIIDRKEHLWCGLEPNVVITETLDCGVIGEGFYEVGRDIRRIASRNTRILPCRVEQYGFLVEAPAAWGTAVVRSDVLGFDLTALNRFTPPYMAIDESLITRRISEIGLVRLYDYLNATEEYTTTSATVRLTSSGLCHGLVSFFRARYGDTVISNGPGAQRCYCWSLAFHPVLEPKAVESGTLVAVVLSPDGRLRLEQGRQ
jgi:type II protein arginine methyltransferase